MADSGLNNTCNLQRQARGIKIFYFYFQEVAGSTTVHRTRARSAIDKTWERKVRYNPLPRKNAHPALHRKQATTEDQQHDKKKNILILFAHPARKRSIINAGLRAAIEGLEGVKVHDLYARYPDFLIDVAHEQQLCRDHDVLILQHPFYWYSTPAILKEWLDLVLEHGWAYGRSGEALTGKIIFQVMTG